jgi:multicomponent Na+:H+ antiporter subunit F
MIEYVVFLLVLGVFVIFVRLAKGPTLPDRVLAFDTINSLVIGIIVLISLCYSSEMFIDIAIVYAMLAFLGNLALSKYLLGREMHEE